MELYGQSYEALEAAKEATSNKALGVDGNTYKGVGLDDWGSGVYSLHDDALRRVIHQASGEDEADAQECYLGYDATTDTFYMGFDVWPSPERSGFSSAIVTIRDGYIARVNIVWDAGFYQDYGGHKSGLNTLRIRYPNTVDIRLD